VYRDRLWQGADMVGLGVASFGYVGGVHMQNLDTFEPYCEAVEAGRIPLARALKPTAEERFIREFVLQLKLGSIEASYFVAKYGVDPLVRYRGELSELAAEGYVSIGGARLALSREGLLRVDSLLPRFFKPEHTAVRYT
jgi:oxygen-independent coproporphyrinogen-3 oxidase